MLNRLAGAVMAALLLIALPAVADDRDFGVVNGTGYAIKFIGVNAPGDEVWNENELRGTLNDGSKVNVKFTGADKGCVWNMKVTWADDNSSSFFRNLNLCEINNVTLKYNRSTDTASYTTD